MKVGFLITGRLKSTRLKEKLLLKVENREFLRWMIDRIKLSMHVNEIVICTSTNPQDDPLEAIAVEEGVRCFRGDEEDVIERLHQASQVFQLEYALNITADCPLVSFEYIDIIVKKFIDTNADFIRCLDLPHGFFAYGIKPEAMKKVCEIKKDSETEVWGRYFTESGLFKVVDLKIPESFVRKDFRLTLDYLEDFEFFKRVYQHFGEATFKTATIEIIRFLDNNPDIVQINQHRRLNYQERWNAQNKFKI